jgi:CopG family transcriptional regulator, nickel-responsive regulator
MMKLSRFSVSVDSGLLERFDRQLEAEGCPSRSKALADLMRASLVRQQWAEGEEVAAAIIMVYDHHHHQLAHNLTHVQHDYHDLIVSSQHIHLDHDNCLEIVVARGKADKVEELSRKLKAVKGVKYISLASASTGQDI